MAQVFAVSQQRSLTAHPLWHRSEPVVAVTEMDPQFHRLGQAMPSSWMALVRVKAILDSIVSLGRPRIQSVPEYRSRVRSLFELLARDLSEVARGEAAAGSAQLARQAGRAAEAAAECARTGTWPRIAIERPSLDEPWLFCGPLRGWNLQESHSTMALIVAESDPFAQGAIDAVDNGLDVVRETVSRTLGGPLRSEPALPEMRAMRLLLAGGIAGTGHKNFAHFFPLDAPGGIVEGRDFTVLFSNMHLTRLQRCSLVLLSKVAERPLDVDASDVLYASTAWFRGHDIAHFWRLDGEPQCRPDLSAFERLVLEECLSDVLGVISVARIVDNELLSVAFAAEMLRYLSRDYHDYADSMAAVLELGWIEPNAEVWRTPERWLVTAMPELAGLAPVLHRAAAYGCEESNRRLNEALETGTAARERWSHVFAAFPSDLSYSFG